MSSPDEQHSPLQSPSPPLSPEDPIASPTATRPPPRMQSDAAATTLSNMTASSQPLGNTTAARRPPNLPTVSSRGGMNPDIAERMKQFSLSRQGAPAPNRGRPSGGAPTAPSPAPAPGGFPAGFRLPPQLNRPSPQPFNSSPVLPGSNAAGAPGGGLAAKRGIKLPGGLPGQAPPSPTSGPAGGKRKPPGMTLSSMGGGAANGGPNGQAEKPKEQTEMEKYAEYIDTKNGALTFKGKARVTGQGIEFTSGKTFHISLDEVETLDELGKGNYGTVYKVRHSAPKFRKAGMGLAGNKALPKDRPTDSEESSPVSVSAAGKNTTGIVMAMKEMRLELDDAKFQSIIMELDILHRCVSPYIIDFYGAFFQEGAVYICIEHMDGGSVDKIYGDGVPENILRKVTLATTLGLKSLKEEHNIIHRDVKPTNILVNTKGQVKICDFGVSGNLVASIARTNIGCQSYMAPERISGGGPAPGAAGGTYSVQSDIWSLGLTIIECAMGRYPYPPETYDNIFSQLAAIVDGEPPDLPADKFSDAARDFVAGCLNKVPKLRPTYPILLQHAWLAPLVKPETILEEDEEAAEAAHAAGQDIAAGEVDGEDEGGFVDREVGEWVVEMLERKRRGLMGGCAKPALHAAPLGQSLGGGGGVGGAGEVVAVDA